MKKRKKYIKYIFTSAIFFYLTFLYLAYLRKDYDAFAVIVVHFFLFFAIYYMAYMFYQLGKEVDNFFIKGLIYLIFNFSLLVLLSPMALLASIAGYLLSSDNYFEKLQKRIKNYFR